MNKETLLASITEMTDEEFNAFLAWISSTHPEEQSNELFRNLTACQNGRDIEAASANRF